MSLAKDVRLYLTNDKMPESETINRDALVHEVQAMIQSACMFSQEEVRRVKKQRNAYEQELLLANRRLLKMKVELEIEKEKQLLPNLQKSTKNLSKIADKDKWPKEVRGNEGGFQINVNKWLLKCFGEEIARDKTERNHRFLEEALELVQSLDCTKSEAHQLVDYVFNRPIGEPYQECGGVMVTLSALCLASDLDMERCGQTELDRIWTKVDKIREKQANKPKHSPLPQKEEPISEDDLLQKFEKVLPMGMPSLSEKCTSIAQQYANDKLSAANEFLLQAKYQLEALDNQFPTKGTKAIIQEIENFLK